MPPQKDAIKFVVVFSVLYSRDQLSNEDDDGSENAAKKIDLRSFKL